MYINLEWREGSSREPRQIIGYIVSNQVTVKIHRLEKLGTLIDGAIAAGGNATRMDGIRFGVEDVASLQKQARDKAVADAKAMADQVAHLSGVSVGRPIYVTDSPASLPYFPAFAGGMAAPAPQSGADPHPAGPDRGPRHRPGHVRHRVSSGIS